MSQRLGSNRWGRGAVPLMCVAVVAAAVACGSHARPNRTVLSPPISARPLAPTATEAEGAKHAAVSTYLDMWRSFAAAGATSDWQSLDLGRHATGAALETLRKGLRADGLRGLVSKGSVTHAAAAMSVNPLTDPTTVVVADCADSTTALKYRVEGGQLADDVAGGRRAISAIVAKQVDGTWRVSDFGVHGVGTC